ncbi:MAG: hypothetical protein QXO97_10015 [Candidatus Nezhaarchaeales archaeon]
MEEAYKYKVVFLQKESGERLYFSSGAVNKKRRKELKAMKDQRLF